MTVFTVTASRPLYKCWKRAVNTIAKEHNNKHLPELYAILEKEYGCKTINARRTIAGAVRFAELEFASENHATLFLLRWS